MESTESAESTESTESTDIIESAKIQHDLYNKIEAVKNLDMSTIYNYKYTYWNVTEYGMDLDNESNIIYGNKREGYENFKSDNIEKIVSPAGKISLRTVTDRDNREIQGYITEEKLSNQPYIDNAREIYELALEEVKNLLGVQDVESFMYYIDQNISSYNFFDSSETHHFKNSIEGLINLIEEYEYDEKFRKYFDKIIN